LKWLPHPPRRPDGPMAGIAADALSRRTAVLARERLSAHGWNGRRHGQHRRQRRRWFARLNRHRRHRQPYRRALYRRQLHRRLLLRRPLLRRPLLRLPLQPPSFRRRSCRHPLCLLSVQMLLSRRRHQMRRRCSRSCVRPFDRPSRRHRWCHRHRLPKRRLSVRHRWARPMQGFVRGRRSLRRHNRPLRRPHSPPLPRRSNPRSRQSICRRQRRRQLPHLWRRRLFRHL
jgi:hypothetical protein